MRGEPTFDCKQIYSVSLLIRHLRCHLLRWRRLSLVPPTDLDFRKIPNQCTAQTQDSPLYGGGHEIDAPFIQQNKRISHGLFLYYRVRYIIASLREGGCAACGVGRRMRAVTHRTPSVASRQLPLQVGGAFHEVRRTVSSYFAGDHRSPLRIGAFWVVSTCGGAP